MDEDELDNKGGEDLFKELLRRLPTADIQDYYNNGSWKDAIMRLDIKILEGHRQEAGSAELIPLEEVQMPELPKAAATSNLPVAVAPKAGLLRPTIAAGGKVAPKLLSLAGKLAPKVAAVKLTPAQVAAKAALLKSKVLLRPGVGKVGLGGFTFPKALTVKPATAGAEARSVAPPPKLGQGRSVAPPPKLGQAAGKTIPIPKVKVALPSIGKAGTIRLGPLAKAAGLGKAASASPSKLLSPSKDVGAAASRGVVGKVASDLTAITSFVAKWGLDQTKAKLALAKLNPQKRSYVMTHFRNPAGPNNGVPAITKLEQYIRQCEQLNSWNSPSAGVKPQVAGARIATPTAARPVPAGAKVVADRATAVASIRKSFAGVGAKIAALKAAASPSSTISPASSSSAKGAAKGAFVRTMAPKAAVPTRTLAARALAPNRLAPGSQGMTVRPPSASAGKGAKPIGGASAIGQGVKRHFSSAAAPSAASAASDPKRLKIAAPAPSSQGGTWKGSGGQKGSGQSYPHSVGKAAASHSVAKSWSAPFTAAKASVVAPKPKAPTKGTLLAAASANRQSASSWAGSGNGSSWGSGGKSTGKSPSSSTNTSWGSGGAKNNWSQGGKANSKGGPGVIKNLLKKF